MIKRQINILESMIVIKLMFIAKYIKKIMLSLEDLIDQNDNEIEKINLGKKIINKITKNKNNFYIFCTGSNGDIIYVASLLHTLKRKYNKDYYLVMLQHQGFFSKLYNSEIKGSVLVSKEEMKKITYYFQRTGNFNGDNYLYAFVKQGMNKKGNINHFDTEWDCSKLLSDRYKESVFHCNLNTKFSKPSYKIDNKIQENICKNNGIDDKTIVLMPASNSEICLSNKFWQALVIKLKMKGYNVFTNVGKNEKPIIGTKSLSLSFEELFCISKKIHSFVSIRSGICDLLALNSSELIVINATKKNYYKWDNVNFLDPNKKAVNIYINWKTNNKIIDEILNIIEGK